jgi:probable DNA metabolism protein
MLAVRLTRQNDFDEWRGKARRLLAAGLHPSTVVWRVGDEASGLFEAGDDLLPNPEGPIGSVPRDFITLAQTVIQHSDPRRFDLLYDLLWRLQADSRILGNATLEVNSLLANMAQSVRRDAHKMTAFVRFRAVPDAFETYVAWFEPDHFILESTAPFFARRFAGMVWGIVTPYASAFWDKQNLTFGPGGSRNDVPAEDAVEEDWQVYYASIFNPARLKVSMMKSEMPAKYWRNLPEAQGIKSLIQNAKTMEEEMIARAATQPPARHVRLQAQQEAEPKTTEIQSLAEATQAIDTCRRCPLFEHATQPVFGEGPATAKVMFVGEQPGDQEDREGRPFIGPAGQVFDEAIEKAGIDRSRLYVTNAVKHFKFEPRGKRRIHQKPNAGEIHACRFWLDLEREFVRPRIIVALGASAAQAIVGKAVSVSGTRGAPIDLDDGSVLFVTNHPAYLLRIPDPEGRAREREKFDADLALIRSYIAELENSQP